MQSYDVSAVCANNFRKKLCLATIYLTYINNCVHTHKQNGAFLSISGLALSRSLPILCLYNAKLAVFQNLPLGWQKSPRSGHRHTSLKAKRLRNAERKCRQSRCERCPFAVRSAAFGNAIGRRSQREMPPIAALQEFTI